MSSGNASILRKRSATSRTERVRDRAYLDSFQGAACWNCGGTGTTVGAHIRWGQEGGVGLKPSDDLTVPLCFSCHASQEKSPGSEWWATMVKNMARRRYARWKRNYDEHP